MLVLDVTPATVVVGLVVLAFAFLAVRRLRRNGTCDSRKGSASTGGCAGGCAGCTGCGAAGLVVADMQHTTGTRTPRDMEEL